MDKAAITDRARGCLIGGAIGDALGYSVEFLSEDGIFSRYGKTGITDYEKVDGFAIFSDDTQMTLFTAEGLLLSGEVSPIRSVESCYLDWLKTQEGRKKVIPDYSRIATEPRLNADRAPGTTCLNALYSYKRGSVAEPINGSKGCGGVMRVAPVGLYLDGEPEEIGALAAECAALTHGHTLGYASASVLAVAVNLLAIRGLPLKEAITSALTVTELLFADKPHIDELGRIVRRAVELSENPPASDLEAIHSLGEGWVGEEALAIAVYCALRYGESFEKAIIAAANHKGDSDSTAAICGNLLGAHLGFGAIPKRLVQPLELRELITYMADALVADK